MTQNKSIILRVVLYGTIISVLAAGIYSSILIFSSSTISLNLPEISKKLSSWYFIFLIPSLTIANIFFRFLRWTFLLRSFGCIFRIKDLFLAYLTAFIGNIFPFYIPYLIRLAPLPKRFYTGLFILIIDLTIDFAALLLLCVLSVNWFLFIIASLFIVLLIVITHFPSKGMGKQLPFTQLCISLCFALCFSLLIWFMTSSVLFIILRDFGIDINYYSSVSIFALSQIKGILALIPAGIMTTGKTLTTLLISQNVPNDIASYITVIVRFLTFWLTIFVSLGASIYYFWYNNQRLKIQDSDHFDTIAEKYSDVIPEHIRTHLLGKKISVNCAFLPEKTGLKGLDIGCGQGWYLEKMQEYGHRVIGIDYSFAQLKKASAGSKTICQGSITSIPLRSESIDFVYSINTFHHLASVHDQQSALSELHRVLKPGGICLIHEMNIKNPIFRLYMSYLFPLIKNIDTGIEIWIKGNENMLFKNFTYKTTVYQTFLPDFLPQFLYRPLQSVEKLFERIPVIQSFSAHLCVVLQKNSNMDSEKRTTSTSAI